MKQTSKRLFSMMLALAFFAAAFFIFLNLIQPTYSDLQKKKGKQMSAEKLLAEEERVVTQAKKLLSQYQKDSQAEGGLALAMPSGPNVVGALAQLYGIATNNNIAVQGVTISPPAIQLMSQPQVQKGAAASGAALAAVKPMGMLSLQFTGTGSYENLKNFLSQLETNVRVFDLTGFSLQPATPGSSGAAGGKVSAAGLFTYSVTVATYYQLP